MRAADKDAANTAVARAVVLLEGREKKRKKLLKHRRAAEKFAVYHALLEEAEVVGKKLFAIIKGVGAHLYPNWVKFSIGE